MAGKHAEMFKRMDANGAGQVSEAEYVALFKRNYAARDSNEDGVLSAEEFSRFQRLITRIQIKMGH